MYYVHSHYFTLSLLPSTFLFPPTTPAPVVFTNTLNVSEIEDYVTTINSEKFGDEFPIIMSIEIPIELVRKFVTMNGDDVRAVSFLYYGFENLFPSGYPGRENS